MNGPDFAGKVQWEGGVVDALDYGLKHTDLDIGEDDELRQVWQELEQQWDVMRIMVEQAESLLEEYETYD